MYLVSETFITYQNPTTHSGTKIGAFVCVVRVRVGRSFYFVFEKEVIEVKESVCKTYDDLPLFLNADQGAKALGVASSSAYDSCMKRDSRHPKSGTG